MQCETSSLTSNNLRMWHVKWIKALVPCLVGGLEHEFYDFPYIGNFMIPTDEVHHFSEGCGWNHQPAVVHTKMLRRMDLCLQNWRGLWAGSPPPGFDEALLALPRSGWNWYSIILEQPLDFSRWIFLIGMKNFGWSGWVVAPSLVIYIHLLFWCFSVNYREQWPVNPE